MNEILRSVAVPQLLFMVVILALIFGPWFFIFKRAGYPAIMGLLVMIPVLGFFIAWWFALTPWPIDKKSQPQA